MKVGQAHMTRNQTITDMNLKGGNAACSTCKDVRAEFSYAQFCCGIGHAACVLIRGLETARRRAISFDGSSSLCNWASSQANRTYVS